MEAYPHRPEPASENCKTWRKAAIEGDLATLSTLIDKKFPIDFELHCAIDGLPTTCTALFPAAMGQHQEAVKILLNAGADPVRRCSHGFDIFSLVAHSGLNAMLRTLLALTPPSDPAVLVEAAACAISNEKPDCLRLLLDAGLRVDHMNAGTTLATLAAALGHFDCLSMLIAAGCDLELTSISPDMLPNPLSAARAKGCSQCEAAILSHFEFLALRSDASIEAGGYSHPPRI